MKSFLFSLLFFAAATARAVDVTGYVYAPDGSALEGARVTAYVPVQRTTLATAVTAKDGAFTLAGVPEGVVQVEVEVEAKDVFALPLFALTSDSPLTFVMNEGRMERQEPGIETVPMRVTAVAPAAPQPGPRPPARGEGTIAGTVLLNGKPLANAPVLVHGVEPPQVVTNAKGEFRVTGLGARQYYVGLDERLAPRLRLRPPVVVDLTKTNEGSVQLEISAAPMIRGRVVDAEGTPVGRARVQMVMADRPALDFAFEPGARTTPDGRYAFPAPEWDTAAQVNVAVTALLHSTVRSKPMAVPKEDRVIDVALPKFEPVTLRVVDRAGKPIPDARVAFATSSETASLEGVELLVSTHFSARAPRTNAQGELVLQLAPDAYDFAASAKQFQIGSITGKRIARATTVDLTLDAAATLRGRVRRGDIGVAGVHVNVIGGRRTRRDSFTTTDAKGAFEITGLAPGTYRLGIFKADELIERTLEVEAPGDIDVALPPAGQIRARVVDAATGAPVTEFVFSVEPTQSEPGSRMMDRGVHRGERSDSGTFTVSVPVGTYRVNAAAGGYAAAQPIEVRVDEREPAAVEIALGRGVIVSGRVTDESGVPVPQADVMIVDAEEQRGRVRRTRVGPGHAQTAENGSFTISGVSTGEAHLTVRKPGFVPFRKTIMAEGTMTVDVQLTKGLSLQGIVTRGGKPVAGVQVGASTSAIGGEHQPAVTDDEGRFVLTGLVPARYTIGAYLEEQHAEVRNVDPTKQKEIAISLDPKPRGIVYGIVTGIPMNAGKIVRRTVMVSSEDGGAEATIDDAGNYRIENAPVGEVMVSAMVETAPRGVRGIGGKRVTLVAGQPVRVDLDLSGDVHVTGRVSMAGKPLAGVNVGFMTEHGTMATAITRDDGTYELSLPEPGRYTINMHAEQLFDRTYTAVREIRGGERVDIDVREQTIEGVVVDANTRLPIPGAFVTLTPMGGGATMPVLAEMPVDANGAFRINTSSGGPYRLIASAHGYAHKAVTLSGSAQAHHALELTPSSELRVRVLDAATGAPLDAHIVVHESDGAYVPARAQRGSDASTYAFSLAPGRYRMTVTAQSYASRTLEVTAPGAVDIRME